MCVCVCVCVCAILQSIPVGVPGQLVVMVVVMERAMNVSLLSCCSCQRALCDIRPASTEVGLYCGLMSALLVC